MSRNPQSRPAVLSTMMPDDNFHKEKWTGSLKINGFCLQGGSIGHKPSRRRKCQRHCFFLDQDAVLS